MLSKPYNQLKAVLGSQNALLEIQALALKELEYRGKASGDWSKFLRELGGAHGIQVNLGDVTPAIAELGRLRILLAIGSLESFFHDLSDLAKVLTGTSLLPEGAKTSDAMQVFGDWPSKSKTEMLYRLISYFLAVRNEAAHPFDNRQHSGMVFVAANSANVCLQSNNLCRNYGISSVPTSSSELEYDHYILCSRIVKDFAFAVWKKHTPGLSDLENRDAWKTRFSRFGPNENRRRQAVVADMRTKYGLDTADAELIYDSTKEF